MPECRFSHGIAGVVDYRARKAVALGRCLLDDVMNIVAARRVGNCMLRFLLRPATSVIEATERHTGAERLPGSRRQSRHGGLLSDMSVWMLEKRR